MTTISQQDKNKMELSLYDTAYVGNTTVTINGALREASSESQECDTTTAAVQHGTESLFVQ